jgi:hypothetical protein
MSVQPVKKAKRPRIVMTLEMKLKIKLWFILNLEIEWSVLVVNW